MDLQSISFDDEVWKDIAGWEGQAQVSNYGRVRTMDKWIAAPRGKTRFIAGRMRKPANNNGYDLIILKCPGKKMSALVHRLVAEAFIGPVGALQINHIDAKKRNNHVSNLEIVTAKQNIEHRDRLGLRTPAKGSKVGGSILVEEQVEQILELLTQGTLTQREIAKKFGVSFSTVHLISKRRTWRHVG